jgi:hypothetical protein
MISIFVDERDWKERFTWLYENFGPPTESLKDDEVEYWAWKLPQDWHFKLRREVLFKRGQDTTAFCLRFSV